jgi:hypothetical protein
METINPYAPTSLTDEVPMAVHLPKSRVSSVAVASRTIAGISLSGGLFGVGMVLVMVVASGSLDPEFLLFAGIAFGVGLVIAGIAGFVSVSILMGLFHLSHRNSDSDDPAGSPWTVKRVNCFAIVAGAISGFASLGILAGGASEALFLAFVPAVVGAIGAYLMVRPCIKLLRQERLDWIAKTSQHPAPLSFESPSI